MACESLEAFAEESSEFQQVRWRSPEQAVAVSQPEGGYLRAVDTLPNELCRKIHTGYATTKPIGLDAGTLEYLRHLRVMSERIERPSHLHVGTEFLSVIALSVKQLANDRLAAGHVVVVHGVDATDQLQSSF